MGAEETHWWQQREHLFPYPEEASAAGLAPQDTVAAILAPLFLAIALELRFGMQLIQLDTVD